jgi:xylulokinase
VLLNRRRAHTVLVGLDLGTSGVKALLLDPERGVLQTAVEEIDVSSPKAGWAEQDPHAWYQASIAVMQVVMEASGIEPEQVAAIAISGQMHGTVCLDAHKKALRPAIIWADQRTRAQVEHIKRHIGVENLAAWTSNSPATGFMLPTWMWLREHEAEVAQATRHLLLPKDYLRYRFIGELGSEPSDASSTSLFDPRSGSWSEPLLQALEIDPGLLPRVHPSTHVAGYLVREVAEAAGLRPGMPVVYGGGDQACQALGHGVLAPGVVSSTIGTGGQLLAPLLQPRLDPELRLHMYCHAIPGHWYLLAATLAAGLSLRWLRNSILPGYTFQELADLADEAPPGAEGLIFLPYLAGERTPHMDPQARGAFVGLTLAHRREHLVRAVMEGVVFALRQGLDLIVEMGVPADWIIASGGGAQHPLWLQLQADIYNRPIYRTGSMQAAALGGALLAGVGAGTFTDLFAACRQVVQLHKDVVAPKDENVSRYQGGYERYRQLYPRLEDIYS